MIGLIEWVLFTGGLLFCGCNESFCCAVWNGSTDSAQTIEAESAESTEDWDDNFRGRTMNADCWLLCCFCSFLLVICKIKVDSVTLKPLRALQHG